MRYTILQGLDALRESTYNAQVVLPLPTGAKTRFIVPGENSSIWMASESHLFPNIYYILSIIKLSEKAAQAGHSLVSSPSTYKYIYLWHSKLNSCQRKHSGGEEIFQNIPDLLSPFFLNILYHGFSEFSNFDPCGNSACRQTEIRNIHLLSDISISSRFHPKLDF